MTRKTTTILLSVLVTILLFSLMVFAYLYYTEKKEKERINLEKEELIQDFETLAHEYEELKTTNDTINLQLTQKQVEIQKLITEITRLKSTNAEIIRQYKKELSTLRSIMRNYVRQIDSLNTMNQMLIAENIEVKKEISKIKTELKQEQEIKEELDKKVQIGKQLTIDNLLSEPLNERGRIKDRIKSVARIRTCFTLRENAIAEAGPRMIYKKVYRPDSILLADSELDTFKINNKIHIFSARREIQYENRDLDVCIYWQSTGDLIEGIYTIELYMDGYKLGFTNLELR
ncbi:hypothetical protein ACFLSA_01230 [Bacteroidota bacterium]